MADSQVSSGSPVRRQRSAGARKRVAQGDGLQHATTENEDEDAKEQQAPLTEDIDPDEEAPIYTITPISRWHPDRVRMWLALGSLALVGLTYLGMFVLIMIDADEQKLALWSTSIGGASTLAGAAVTFFFTKRENTPTRRSR